jgi:hypothetical protein
MFPVPSTLLHVERKTGWPSGICPEGFAEGSHFHLADEETEAQNSEKHAQGHIAQK